MSNNEDCINLSLDEYIRRRKVKDQFCLLEMRKKDKNIDKDELDASLEKMAHKNKVARSKMADKFDRFNDDYDSNSSDDEEKVESNECTQIDGEDVAMTDLSTENSSIRFAQEIEKMDHPDCCKFKEFKTVENELGIKVRPQQWRLMKENLDRPKGVPRLVALPLSDEERFKKIKCGRVNKSYKKKIQNDDQNIKAGIYVDKGNFTFKLDTESKKGDETENLVGIVRNNKPKVVAYDRNNNFIREGVKSPPVNINMNWNSFFKGFADCVKVAQNNVQPVVPSQPPTIMIPASETSVSSPQESNSAYAHTQFGSGQLQKKEVDLQLKVAANDLLDYLLNKREKERKEAALKSMQQQFIAFDVNEKSGNAFEQAFSKF